MNHNFDVEIAVKYGVLEAILFENIAYWVDKNKANDMHFHDGLYWTYNSSKAFSEMFPYASSRTISRALHHLCDEGLITMGNYNTSSYDRTTWYAVTEKGMAVRQNVTIHLPKCQMDESDCQIEVSKMSNRSVKNGEPIPDINTDINTDLSSGDDSVGGDPADALNISDKGSSPQEKPKHEVLQYDVIKELFNSTCKNLPEIQAMSKSRKRAVQTLLTELKNLKIMPGLSPYDKLLRLFQLVQNSDFLSGRNGRWDGCSFDWIFNKKNALKILEGNYANKGGENHGGNSAGTGIDRDDSGGGAGLSESAAKEALELFRRYQRGNDGV